MGIKNLFKSKSCPIHPEHLSWIEYSYQWLIENYGLKKLRKQPIVHITETHFPSMYSEEEYNFDKALYDLKNILDLQDLVINVQPVPNTSKNSELKITEIDQKREHTIILKEEILSDVDVIITLLAIEMCKIKLNQSEISIDQEDDSELFLYIAMIYFGFGVVISKNLDVLETHLNEETPLEIQSHCLAFYFWLRDETDHDFINQFDLKLRSGIKKSINYYNSAHCPLKKSFLEQMDQSNEQLRDSWNFYNNGHYDIAISLAKEAINTNKTNPFIYNSIAEFLIRKEQYNEAEKYLNEALKLNSDFSHAQNNLGFCKLMTNDIKTAKKLINLAISLDRSNAFAYRNKGILMTIEGDYDQAFKAFSSASRIDSKIELLNYYLGEAHLENNNKPAAIAEFEKSSEKGEPEGTLKLQNLVGYQWQPRDEH